MSASAGAPERRGGLRASARPLCDSYDCAVLDLDGVVYLGPSAIPGVPDVLQQAQAAGMTRAFVTNNAARTPEAVAEQLRSLGVHVEAGDVVTSAQAAARELLSMLGVGAAVLVVGGVGLNDALRAVGLKPVSSVHADPVAVVQGFSPDVGWRQLAEASYLIAAGLPWVATNMDLTVPTADGIAPGNGALVAAVATAGGRDPDVVAGKPYRPLLDETVRRTGARRPLFVGDRLDTDIEGAVTYGADSLLVLTGVTDLHGLCAAPPQRRPTYVARTLAGLLTPHDVASQDGRCFGLEQWSVEVTDAAVVLDRTGADADDGLRAVVAAAWHWYDRQPADAAPAARLDVSAAAAALNLR